jgi:hypothetical protein
MVALNSFKGLGSPFLTSQIERNSSLLATPFRARDWSGEAFSAYTWSVISPGSTISGAEPDSHRKAAQEGIIYFPLAERFRAT